MLAQPKFVAVLEIALRKRCFSALSRSMPSGRRSSNSPLTKVPPRLPKSRTQTSGGLMSSRQWWREMVRCRSSLGKARAAFVLPPDDAAGASPRKRIGALRRDRRRGKCDARGGR